MKRLLLLTPDFPPAVGGIQLLLARLVAHLTADYDITVVTRRSDPTSASLQEVTVNVDIRSTTLTGRPGLIDVNARAIAAGLSRSFDIVLSGHVTTAPAAAALRATRGIPFVQYTYADEVPHRQRLARFAMRQAACTIAISGHTRALDLAAGCPLDRLHVIPPGVDIPRARSTERSQRPTIVTVARLEDRYKGHDVMLEALQVVRARIPDVLWVVVGDGSLREELERNAERLGLTDHVEFTGRVSDEERDRRLGAANVFAMPSRLPPSGTEGGEGFGIVYLEAGLHDLPVVAGDVGGALDAVIDGETGLLVDPTSPDALADALCRLLLDPVRARALGEAGARYAETFSWERMGRDVETVLAGALGR